MAIVCFLLANFSNTQNSNAQNVIESATGAVVLRGRVFEHHGLLASAAYMQNIGRAAAAPRTGKLVQ
jgi:hypothetical protein